MRALDIHKGVVELSGDSPLTDETYAKLLGRITQVEQFHVLWEAERVVVAWDHRGDRKGETGILKVDRELILSSGTVDGLYALLETEAAIQNVVD